MDVENDCEDQGMSYLATGCTSCIVGYSQSDLTPIRAAFIIEKRDGHRYWQCPKCKGNYGELTQPKRTFQQRVADWMMDTFGVTITFDKMERNHRFLEEALELVQSLHCTRADAHMLVDWVFSRPIGDPHQEVGGAYTTLHSLCHANQLRADQCGEEELARCWQNQEKIRAKQKGKPKHSPLPTHYHD